MAEKAFPPRSVSLLIEPRAGVERVHGILDGGVWRATTDDPQFVLAENFPFIGDDLFLLEWDVLAIEGGAGLPVVYFDFGDGFDERNAVRMGRSGLSLNSCSTVVRLRKRPAQVRLDPCGAKGQFFCSEFFVCPIAPERATLAGMEARALPYGETLVSSATKPALYPDPMQSTGSATPRIAAIVHLFYEDLWPEIAEYVGHIPRLNRLYVSVRQDAPADIEARIIARFPFALVRRVPNRGRDVLPFLQWLEVAALHGIELVCKIHSKRSTHVATGDAWRRDMLDKLVGSPRTVEEVLDQFAIDPSLGIMGPGGHVVSSEYYWARNATRVEQLALRLGQDVRDHPFRYVAGSMFWARVDALLPLRRLSLSDADFEAESGLEDGTLAHAIERCFPIAAAAAGSSIGESRNTTGARVEDFAPPGSPPRTYATWIGEFEAAPHEYQLLAREHASWGSQPVISIVMPAYNSPGEQLVAAIESVLAQVYPHWELCIADDASSEPHVREMLEQYRRRDSRIKVVYREDNGHISAASNSAIELASGAFIGLLDHDDLLHPLALHYVAEAIIAHPDVQLVYTDEDKLDLRGQRCDPYFKCEFNYELLLAQNMVCHFACFGAQRLRELGGFRLGFEGAQDYDLVLRFCEALPASRIVHVPRVLYHWRMGSGSTAMSADEKPYARIAGRKAVEDHLLRTGQDATVEAAPEEPGMNRVRFRPPTPAPQVGIVIPTRDRADLVEMCVGSILSRSSYRNYSIVIVDNASREPASLKLFERLRASGVTILHDESAFNFSALNNRAVRSLSSDFVCLLNNDIEVMTPDWLEEMVGMAARPGIGAVGARLWYPDRRLQHAGAIIGIGGVAGHSHKYLPKGERGYFSRAVLHQEVSAVTAACLVIRRSTYEQVGGLDESLSVAFNDIDFCLRVRAAGYRNVWTPYAEMIHYESASRGHETTPEKQARFQNEVLLMMERWGDVLRKDPAYSPNLTLEHEDFSMAWPPRVEPMVHSKREVEEVSA